MARKRLRREQSPCRDRQPGLHAERRRIPDAGQEGSAAARPAVFHAITKIARPPAARRAAQDQSKGTTVMLDRMWIGAITLAAALMTTIAGAPAQDMSRYPDWSGQWRK